MEISKEVEKLKTFESVQRWTTTLTKHAGEKNTVIQYLRGMRTFCEWVKKNPDQLVEERMNDLKSDDIQIRARAEDQIDRFYAAYKDQSQSRAVMIHAIVKSFYKANHLPLTTKTPRMLMVREEEIMPTPEQIRRMGDISDLRDKTLIVWMAEGGFRIGSLIQLQIKDAKDLYTGKIPCAVKIPSAVSKGKLGYIGFVCQDAVDLMKQYLERRRSQGETINEETYLFKGTGDKNLTKTYASTLVTNAAVATGLIKNQKGVKSFRSHCFRKRVQTTLEGSGIPLNWVDYLLGHVPRGADASAYSRPTPEQLREAYAKAMPKLQIYGGEGLDEAKINEIAYKRAEEMIKIAIATIMRQTQQDDVQTMKVVTSLDRAFEEHHKRRRGEKPQPLLPS